MSRAAPERIPCRGPTSTRTRIETPGRAATRPGRSRGAEDRHPREQGLKLHMDGLVRVHLRSRGPTSTRTRIETKSRTWRRSSVMIAEDRHPREQGLKLGPERPFMAVAAAPRTDIHENKD